MKVALSQFNRSGQQFWQRLGANYLPFADAASTDLPWLQLLRLSLFQFSVGLCLALTIGTLNRVLIVELSVSSGLVAAMIALPVLAAPLRALIGHRSDQYRSVLGWKRVPYLWMGAFMQFGGLAIMPFALILLSQATDAPRLLGLVASAIAFLAIGFGIQTSQTAGLALATDLAPRDKHPRVIAMMYVMLLAGLLVSGIVFSFLLVQYSNTRLVQVVQGAAVTTVLLNLLAGWKQEPRRRGLNEAKTIEASFGYKIKQLLGQPNMRRYLLGVALGSAAFGMQDVILEPYGAQILGLDVSNTSLLTAILAAGSVIAYLVAARYLGQQMNPARLAGVGLLIGLPAFSMVIFAEPFQSAAMFRIGTFLIGIGSGLFAVSTLASAMQMDQGKPAAEGENFSGDIERNSNGLVLGAWGAASATAGGLAMALGGTVRDLIDTLATQGALGPVLAIPATGYSFVYHLELLLLLLALAVIGPIARFRRDDEEAGESQSKVKRRIGFTDLPT